MSRGSLGTYQKLTLDPESKRCRVLHLLPGSEQQQLCGELQIVDLENPNRAQYSCISYVWGDQSVTGPITINSEELQVTTNLLNCLYHLRRPQHTIVLWIDAVCIHQEDLSEKSHQVGMMGEIYSQCSTVYLWLGCTPDLKPLTVDPFTLIRHFAGNGHYHDLPGFTKDSDGTVTFQESQYFLALWDSFLHVAQSTWWKRSWTVQEAVLPSTAVAMYGHWTIPFDEINLARENRNRHIIDPRQCGCTPGIAAFPQRFRRIFSRFLLGVEFVERLRLHHIRKHNPGYAHEPHWTGPSLDPPFHEVVETFSFRNCQDARDKIFSLLAMATSSAFTTFRPDYRVSTSECYTDVFGRMLLETGYDYRCLLGAAFHSNLPGLPSWVRDFSQSCTIEVAGEELRRLQIYSLFNASGGRPSRLLVQKKKELHATGVLAGTIKVVGESAGDIHYGANLKDVFDGWVKLCETAINSTDETLVRKALSRVVCPVITEDLKTLQETGRAWRCIDETEMPGETEWQAFLNGTYTALEERHKSGAGMSITGRSLYMTETGQLGLADAKAQAGDEVWVLFGAKVPFILRNTASEGHPRGTHTFVGDCFLDGAMDGEIVQGRLEGRSLIIV